jgi:hypothetical protein
MGYLRPGGMSDVRHALASPSIEQSRGHHVISDFPNGVRHCVLQAVYRWKGRKRKLGYRNYRSWKLFAIFCFLGLLGGLLIGSLI